MDARTGTPIKSTDKDTYVRFSVAGEGYLDKYGIDDAVRDGATVPILFDRWFVDLADDKRDELKRKGLTLATIAKHPERIHLIALDIWEHFKTVGQPDGYKAQVVAVDREAVVLYRGALSAVIAADLERGGMAADEAWAKADAMLACVYSKAQEDNKPSENPNVAALQRDLQTFYATRARSRKASTINREIDVARAVWEHADKMRFDVGEKPDWRSLKRRERARPDRELSSDEERLLFQHLREDVRDAVDFLLKSGWRRNEVLNLRWSDCDLKGRTAITRIKGGDVVRRPINDALVVLIERQPKECDYVFTYMCQRSRSDRRRGARYHLTATALRKPFAEAMSAAGIESFRLHDLRHTRATRIVRNTGSLAAAKAALAHKSITTTQRYAHATDDDTRRALDASESRNSPEASREEGAES